MSHQPDTQPDSSQARPAPLVATDCCGRLLPEPLTLTGDIHIPDLCPACRWLDWREHSAYVTGPDDDQPDHERHVSCDDGQCPGRDWTYQPAPVHRPDR